MVSADMETLIVGIEKRLHQAVGSLNMLEKIERKKLRQLNGVDGCGPFYSLLHGHLFRRTEKCGKHATFPYLLRPQHVSQLHVLVVGGGYASKVGLGYSPIYFIVEALLTH